MNLAYKHLLSPQLPPTAKVWIYQCNRPLQLSEALEMEDLLLNFSANWKSHGRKVNGSSHVFFGQFIVLMASEEQESVSGCSIDGSVQVLKELEAKFNISLFDRTQLAFFVADKIELIPLAQFNYALTHKFIKPETFYFNNTVQTKKELETNWIIPIHESWLYEKFTAQQVS